MSKERLHSRRKFIAFALGLAGGIAAREAGKRLPFFEPLPEFSQEEIEQFKGIDIALIFNPGGWGYTSLEEDPGWKEILENIEKELKNRGYKTKIFEEFRRKGPFLPLSVSVVNTVKKVGQLAESLPELKIILAGFSSGASFVEGILKALPENRQILAIEAIRPFEKGNPLVAPERTLVIKNPHSDPVQEGNIREILRGCLPPSIFIGEGGDFGIGKLRMDFQFPGHDSCCSWNSEIAEVAREFLDLHFPSKE